MATTIIAMAMAASTCIGATNEQPTGAGTNLTIQVTGAVHKPGIVQYEDGMTVMKAIAAAGGFTVYASMRVRLFRDKGGFTELPAPYRVTVGDPKDSVLVNIRDIINGRAPDLQLRPGDLITIREEKD